MVESRKHYDWLFIIKDWHLIPEFKVYVRQHPKVKSIKRLARSFVKSKSIPLFSGYVIGSPLYPCTHRIAEARWIDD